MVYPLKFIPIHREKVWGGNSIARLFGRAVDDKSLRVGETWEVACHPNGTNLVANGRFMGLPFNKLLASYGDRILGVDIVERTKSFPLLIKFIDAQDCLSVQVHPDDTYAAGLTGEKNGKTEMWYILHADDGAEIVYGLKDYVTKELLEQAIVQGAIVSCLKTIHISTGDALLIPPGTVHAIGAGIVLAEIQQSSDVTYRLYDWDRAGLDGTPRELHIKDALNVIDFSPSVSNPKSLGLRLVNNGFTATYVTACPHFAVEVIDLNHACRQRHDGRRFTVYTCIEGCVHVHYGHDVPVEVALGESVLVPACISNYLLTGKAKLIKTYVPDLTKDIVEPLTAYGYELRDLYRIGGLCGVLV